MAEMKSPEPVMSITIDTSGAETAVDSLSKRLDVLREKAEQVEAIASRLERLPLLSGATNVTTVAPQDPQTCWETIRSILAAVKAGRLTVAQAAVALRASITIIGHEEALTLLEPCAKKEVPRAPEPPHERADQDVKAHPY